VAFLTYGPAGHPAEKEVTLVLEERHAFTGVIELQGLAPATPFVCQVSFGQTLADLPADRLYPRYNTGTFRTAPSAEAEVDLNFIFGSCNLHSLGIVSSPDPAYRRIGELVQEKDADFMLHCGDQIYYDLPIPVALPSLEIYRSKYLDAWGDSEPTAALLTKLPNYMILDDHEIFDDFSNDKEIAIGSLDYVKTVAIKAYREFQHIHNPQTYGNEALYYNFSFGRYQFFVMDIRTERYTKPPGVQMIGVPQMNHFFEWLQTHRNAVKFVISSGPFVGEVRNSSDKWSGETFRAQREQIIDFIAEHDLPNIIFLTGDRHNSYHATMDITRAEGNHVIVHELMSSPINQLSKRALHHYHPTLQSKTGRGTPYTCQIDVETYYATHSNMMWVQVTGNVVNFEIYRTKKEKPPRRTGSFTLVDQ
jgi:phosphodiesterase/alkaline phosphatase D-like protein